MHRAVWTGSSRARNGLNTEGKPVENSVVGLERLGLELRAESSEVQKELYALSFSLSIHPYIYYVLYLLLL